MKLVGITVRVDTSNPHGERRDALDQRWYPFLQSVGLAPVLLPNHAAAALFVVQKVDVAGLILSGGNTLTGLPGGDAPERDEAEVALITWAADRRLPVMGVCRGMQFVQKYFGSALEQITGHAGTRHEVAVGGASRSVNSYHNFGCRKTVPSLEVLATAPDGVIEEVRHAKSPVHAIMWHPEREATIDARDQQLFRTHFGS